MIEIRSVAIDDPVSLALDNQVWTLDSLTAGDVRRVAAWYREHETWLVLEDGEPRATGFTGIPPHRDKVGVRISVPPPYRRRGLGTALWRTASRWAAARGHDELHGWIVADDDETLASAAKRGYVEIGRDDLLELDLTTVRLPTPEPPAGIRLTNLAERPELERGVYEVARAAWIDIPGHEHDEVEPYEDWQRLYPGEHEYPRAAMIVAVTDEDVVVGYSQLHVRSGNRAWHAMTGVRREWRGRGVTTNETRNEPIRRINERLGFVPRPGRIRLKGPLSDEP